MNCKLTAYINFKDILFLQFITSGAIYILMLVSLACPLITNGQDGNHFVNEYLLKATEDQRVEQRGEERLFLENDRIRSSWIREAEIRLRTSQYKDPIEDYRFRVSPSNPWEVRANQSYHNQLSQMTHITYQVALSKALKSRYLDLIDSYFFTRRSEILEEKLSLKNFLADQSMQLTTSLSTEDLLEMESDISRLEIEHAELSLKLLEINHRIAQSTHTPVQWEDWSMIRPEAITTFIIAHDTSISQNLYKDLTFQEMELEQKMYQISKAEAFSNIGFIQADMDLGQGDRFGEHMGFQVGISLPIVNKDKANLARDRFEMIEKKNEAEQTRKEIDQEVVLLLQRLRSLNGIFALVSQKIERATMISESLPDDPDEFTLFKYKSYQLSLLEKQYEVHENILNAYISYLDIHGLLVTSPMINYITTNLSEIH